jgi:hypothetical protein
MNYMQKEIYDEKIKILEYKKESLELERMLLIINSLNVKLKKDGNSWCYVHGNLPESDCIAGYGNTPKEALKNFYENWETK